MTNHKIDYHLGFQMVVKMNESIMNIKFYRSLNPLLPEGLGVNDNCEKAATVSQIQATL